MHPTILLIGGLPRCGKTTLSEYILKKDGISHFPLDAMQSFLNAVAPDLGIDVDMGHAKKTEKFFPILHMLVKTLWYHNTPMILEGDAITPEHASKLQKEYGVKAIFLGDTTLTLEGLRSRTGKVDWISGKTDEELQEVLEEIVRESAWYRVQCEKYNFPYIELTNNSEKELLLARKRLYKR